MNKTLKRLLVAALALSASQVSAHTNQTYLNTRSHGVNTAMDQATTWEAHHAAGPDRFGGTLSVTGFYTDSGDKGDLGKYFLFGDSASQKITRAEGARNDTNVLSLFISGGNASSGLVDGDTTVKFNPSQTAYGVAFNYHQELDKILEGLHFCVKLPIVRVENDMGISTEGANKDMVKQLLSGSLTEIAAGANGARKNLGNALIKGKQNATGVADIDVALGYSFLRKESYHAAINLGLTIPTGNEADGKTAFQPIYGNGNHFGFGGGLNFGARMWGDHHTNIKLHAALNFRYLFEATEKRTLGIKDTSFGQYRSVVKAVRGTTLASAVQPMPAANVLTQNVGVTPGAQLDGILALSYNNGGLTLDLGYNLYFREEESVKTKDAWDNAAYSLVDNHTANLNLAGGNAGNLTDATVALTKDMLSTDAARTPSQFSNKIYGGVGYIFREWEYPVFVGAGAHYEFAAKNSVVENWGINGKVGISF